MVQPPRRCPDGGTKSLVKREGRLEAGPLGEPSSPRSAVAANSHAERPRYGRDGKSFVRDPQGWPHHSRPWSRAQGGGSNPRSAALVDFRAELGPGPERSPAEERVLVWERATEGPGDGHPVEARRRTRGRCPR